MAYKYSGFSFNSLNPISFEKHKNINEGICGTAHNNQIDRVHSRFMPFLLGQIFQPKILHPSIKNWTDAGNGNYLFSIHLHTLIISSSNYALLLRPRHGPYHILVDRNETISLNDIWFFIFIADWHQNIGKLFSFDRIEIAIDHWAIWTGEFLAFKHQCTNAQGKIRYRMVVQDRDAVFVV